MMPCRQEVAALEHMVAHGPSATISAGDVGEITQRTAAASEDAPGIPSLVQSIHGSLPIFTNPQCSGYFVEPVSHSVSLDLHV